MNYGLIILPRLSVAALLFLYVYDASPSSPSADHWSIPISLLFSGLRDGGYDEGGCYLVCGR